MLQRRINTANTPAVTDVEQRVAELGQRDPSRRVILLSHDTYAEGEVSVAAETELSPLCVNARELWTYGLFNICSRDLQDGVMFDVDHLDCNEMLCATGWGGFVF